MTGGALAAALNRSPTGESADDGGYERSVVIKDSASNASCGKAFSPLVSSGQKRKLSGEENKDRRRNPSLNTRYVFFFFFFACMCTHV